VFYQPAEYQPHALDAIDGPNFQILVNALYFASGLSGGALLTEDAGGAPAALSPSSSSPAASTGDTPVIPPASSVLATASTAPGARPLPGATAPSTATSTSHPSAPPPSPANASTPAASSPAPGSTSTPDASSSAIATSASPSASMPDSTQKQSAACDCRLGAVRATTPKHAGVAFLLAALALRRRLRQQGMAIEQRSSWSCR